MDRLLASGARLAGRAKDKGASESASAAVSASPRRVPGALAVPAPSPTSAAAAAAAAATADAADAPPSPSTAASSCYARPKRAAVAASVLGSASSDPFAVAASAPALSPAEAAACAAAAAKMKLAPAGGEEGGCGATSSAGRSRALVVAALSANPLLRDLAPGAIDAVADSMRPRCVPPGRDIITQGDAGGRELFVIESGAAEVWLSPPAASSTAAAAAAIGAGGAANGSSSSFSSASASVSAPPVKVHAYGPGSSFGELALMYNAPRAATVRAAVPPPPHVSSSPSPGGGGGKPPSPAPAAPSSSSSSQLCRLWVADRAVVATVRRHWAARDQVARLEAVARVRAFWDLGDGARLRLAEALRPLSLAPGERLFAGGEPAEALFVVRSGAVRIGGGGGDEGAEMDRVLPAALGGGGGGADGADGGGGGGEHDDETEGVAGEGAVLGAGPALRAQEHDARQAAAKAKAEATAGAAGAASSSPPPKTTPSSSSPAKNKTAAAAAKASAAAAAPAHAEAPKPPPLPQSCRHALDARATDLGAQVFALRTRDLAALLGGAPLAQVTRCEALRRCGALSGAGDARLWALARASEAREGYGRGDVVFRAGDAPDCFYVVVEGAFECRASGPAAADGGGAGAGAGAGAGGASAPRVLATVVAGQCFGEKGLIEAAKEEEDERHRRRRWQQQQQAAADAAAAAAATAAAASAKGSKSKSKSAAAPAPPPPLPPPPPPAPPSAAARRQATVVCVSPRGRLVAVGRDAFASLVGDLPSLRALWREGALRRVPLFDGLSGRERAAVASALQPIEVRAGEAVVVQGERGDHFFVVERGVLDAYRRADGKAAAGARTPAAAAAAASDNDDNGDGNDDDDDDDIGDIGTVVRSYGAGDYFGELALLSERSLRAATVVARTDASLLALGSPAFCALFPAAVRGALREAAAAYTGRRTARPGWPSAVRLADLEELGVLGCGGFGRVSLVRLREGSAALAITEEAGGGGDGKKKKGGGGGGGGADADKPPPPPPPPPPALMALKAMWKSHIVASQLTAHVHRERDTMLEVAMAGSGGPSSADTAREADADAGNESAGDSARPSALSSSSSSCASSGPSPPGAGPCPWLVTLHASFSDDRRVYLLMDACPGGELFSYLRTRPRAKGPLPEKDARFYVAAVALALRELHARQLVYRDLKPENILLDARGYPRLADFGFVKRVPPGGRTHTLCGTPEYLAPELVERRGHWQAADWWALGVLAYELSAGIPPFYARDPVAMYALIREAKPRFPAAMSPELRDFCGRLLHRTPALRLGAGERGAADVVEHAWFAGFDWRAFERGDMAAPYVPPVMVAPAASGGGVGAGGKKGGGGGGGMTAAALAAAAQADAEMAASGLAGCQYRDVAYASRGDFADF